MCRLTDEVVRGLNDALREQRLSDLFDVALWREQRFLEEIGERESYKAKIASVNYGSVPGGSKQVRPRAR